MWFPVFDAVMFCKQWIWKNVKRLPSLFLFHYIWWPVYQVFTWFWLELIKPLKIRLLGLKLDTGTGRSRETITGSYSLQKLWLQGFNSYKDRGRQDWGSGLQCRILTATLIIYCLFSSCYSRWSRTAAKTSRAWSSWSPEWDILNAESGTDTVFPLENVLGGHVTNEYNIHATGQE